MRKWILPVASGFLLILAYPPFNLELFIWLGFAPLFLFIFSKDRLTKEKFWAGFIAGSLYFLIVMKWFWSVYPLAWAGLESRFWGFLLIFSVWAISGLGMGLWWGVNTAFLSKFSGRRFFILIPSVFVISEYLRSWFFGLLWAGSGTLWGPHWTMGNPAYALHNNPLFLKLSSFAGIYGIIFLVVLINALIFELINSHKKANLIAAISIIVLLTLVPKLSDKIFLSNSLNLEKIAVAVIQTKETSDANHSPEKKLEDFKLKLGLFRESTKLNPQPKAVIFPEGSDFFKNLSLFLDTEETRNFFGNSFSEPTLIIDNSKITDEAGRLKSRVIYLDSKKGALGFYDKRFLTPGGEFLPYHLKSLIDLFSKDAATKFAALREFSGGAKPTTVIESESFKAGALACSGIISPSLFRELSKQNPDFLIILASTGLFKGTDDLISQDLAAAKFRAAENDKYLILAANYGLSYVVSNAGKIEKIASDKEPGLFTTQVVPRKNRTWYNKIGDTPILIIVFSIILINGTATKRRNF